MDEQAIALKSEFDALAGIRFNWESYWADIGKRILPHQNVFMRPVLGTPQAERRTEYIFDSTATQALDNCAALFEAMLFPRTQRWHKLSPTDPTLENDRDVNNYLEGLTSILFDMRYSPKSNFASQAHENMLGVLAFGSGSVFIDEDMAHRQIRYRAINLQDLYFAENHVGIIDRVFRKFDFTATQAAEQWGRDALPDGVKAALDIPARKHQVFEWLHVCKTRKDPQYGRIDTKGMPYASWYLCLNPLQIIEESGYRVFPYATSRFQVGPREVYGRSPAFTALADIKMLNEMSRTDINASQMAVNPPILLPEAGQSFALRPSALNYGYVTEDGKPLAVPFVSGAKVDIAEEKMERRRKSIEDAFMGNLYKMLMDHPDMTATQVLQMLQERGILLTPVLGRQQGEFLGNLINREIDILAHAGVLMKLGPMPEKLQQAGGLIKIEYTSQLNKLQRAQDGVAIQSTIQGLLPMAEIHPEVFDAFDWTKVGAEYGDINGVPQHLMLSEEQQDALKAQKAKAQQMQQLVQAAPQVAAAAKDAAQAHGQFAQTMQAQQQQQQGQPQ